MDCGVSSPPTTKTGNILSKDETRKVRKKPEPQQRD
jgi:hypothetical protein